ncbi:MAG TPA: hypothetical protein VN703_08910, partial [Candidatus Sulfopaludibacter sp.]|nr:hypothetical protein [Candidatus Sulfopaludibacter sp.]
SSFKKSIIERTMQYIKDRTETFDDYFPCRKKNKCKLNHVKQWLNLFIDQHNKEILSKVNSYVNTKVYSIYCKIFMITLPLFLLDIFVHLLINRHS